VAQPLLEGEQLSRAVGDEPMVLDRPVAAASWPSGRRRKTTGGAHASVREMKGEGRVGRPKATGPADQWADAGRGEVEACRGEEREGRPAGLTGPKAKWAGKASQAESEK
jgi:hypothetical protein